MPSSARGSTGSDESDIMNFFPSELVRVIETTSVQEFSQEFKGWLSSKCLRLWHVKIINENQHLCEENEKL